MATDKQRISRLTTKSSKCPVCNKPRGPGTDHGICMEIRAKIDGKKPSGFIGEKGRVFTEDEHKRAVANQRKKQYLLGKNLPPWMFD